jgi:ornithine--oxo-acid transaminase
VKEIPHDQAEIIVCANNFHGRTISVISFSTEEQYRAGFGPFTPGFKVIPFGDAAALEQAITPHTCAFLCEPIQGEAGILLPPPGYLALAAKICHENNVLFMLDEIQSGLGRTGKMFAYQYEEATPDILIIGKALAGGFYPVSGILSSRSILELFGPGDHGSTFGGNPLGCAVAREALKVIVDEKLCERSFTLGAYFMQRLRKLRNPVIREVRGKGLWIGIELTVPARPYCERLRELGVLCKETHEKVIRIAPPLVITQDEAGWACDRFLQVFGESDR